MNQQHNAEEPVLLLTPHTLDLESHTYYLQHARNHQAKNQLYNCFRSLKNIYVNYNFNIKSPNKTKSATN